MSVNDTRDSVCHLFIKFLFLLHSAEFSLLLPKWIPSTDVVSASLNVNQRYIENSSLFLYLVVGCSNPFTAFVCNVMVNQGTANNYWQSAQLQESELCNAGYQPGL